jgi:cephalosporin-C deacetylase
MALYDLPLGELRSYRPEIDEPADFDEFWAGTLAEAREHDLGLRVEPVDSGLRLVEVYDVTFAGFGGHPVRAWYTRPAGVTEDLPIIVEFQGYGGGRGFAHERLGWPSAGYAHLLMDSRGQGGSWGSGGSTPDPVGAGPHTPGVMTMGIESPHDHYYRRLFTDGVRAVDAARALPGVDGTRVGLAGGSQGGGIQLAVAGLVPEVFAAMPDVPFLCHFRRAVEVTDGFPYGEITRYLSVNRDMVETTFRTLSYLDGVSFARRARAAALFSVALMDTTCPPSTVYAAFNHYGTQAAAEGEAREKEIVEYPFNQHEGGAAYQFERQMRWFAGLLRRRCGRPG